MNQLFFLIGPPKVAPNWFWTKFGMRRGLMSVFRWKKLRASMAELRRYSYALPWNSFEPLRVCTLTMPPEDRPNSAGALAVNTLNSEVASTEGCRMVELIQLSLLSMPSTMKLLFCPRCPLA